MSARLPLALVAALIAASACAQSPKTRGPVDMVKDVAALLSKQYPSSAALKADADRVARLYAGKLKTIRREVTTLADESRSRIADLGLQQKLNLAMQLWRIRASLDLLALTDPEVIKELTGLDVPDFRNLRRRFEKTQTALGGVLPGL